MPTKYKLTTQKLTTYEDYQWEEGKWQIVDYPGRHYPELNSPGVFNYYDNPLVAVLMNPIHSNILDPILWEAEIKRSVAHDGITGGCEEMMLKRKLEIPILRLDQRIEIAITLASLGHKEPNFLRWANKWVGGIDRLAESAKKAVIMAQDALWAGTAAPAIYAAEAALHKDYSIVKAEIYAARAVSEVAKNIKTDPELWSGQILIPFLVIIYKLKGKKNETT